MTVTSRLPALIDYLFARFSADATLGGPVVDGAQTGPVTVYDGPPVTALDAPLKLYVGLANPDDPAAEPAGESSQEWASLGRRGRNETVTVHCCAEAWSGADDIRTVRVAAFGIVAAAETLMQADSGQFGGNVLFPDPGMTGLALLQNSTDRGAIARVAFDLVFRSRIGG